MAKKRAIKVQKIPVSLALVTKPSFSRKCVIIPPMSSYELMHTEQSGDLTLKYFKGDPLEYVDGMHYIGVYHKNHRGPMAQLVADEKGAITNIEVHPDFRRQGVATAMWNYANKVMPQFGGPSPQHSEMRTPEGEAWAKSVNAPPASKPISQEQFSGIWGTGTTTWRNGGNL